MTAPVTTAPQRRSGARRVLAAVLAVPLVAATMLLGRLIAITAPIGDDHRRPFIRQGQMNETILEHDIEVTVLSVRGGRAFTNFSGVSSTEGLFLLVRARAEALQVPSALKYADLLDDAGHAYAAISHSDALYERELLPGIPVEGEILFEVPPEAATQLRLRLSSHRGYWPEYQVIVEMPLPIDADKIDDWYNDAAPLTLMEPEVVG